MTLISKNDVNQIFAINAPAQDKPASFVNYPSGWDTARSNNGRPTIRQFNFLQQRTDQNILWIHQNGAALPYDSNIEYADGAVVVKDDELQKKSGPNWVSVGGSSYGQKWKSNPNGYALNDRVMLDNGDIVKSTVTNNTKNPNVDMTGWVNVSVEKIDGLQHLQFDTTLRKDGTQQDPALYVDVLADKRSVALANSHYHPLNEMIFDGKSVVFDGNGSRFQATGMRRVFNLINTGDADPRVDIRNIEFDQEWNPDPGTGGANNNPVLRFRAIQNPRAFYNRISASMGISTSANNITEETKKQTSFATICFNFFKDQQKQCVEGYGSEHNVIIGNSGDVPLLNSNALRVTGAEDPVPVYNLASVYVGNTFKGGQGTTGSGKYAAGISVQTRVRGLSAVANATQNFRFGVNIKGGTTLENQGRANYIQSSAVSPEVAVYAESPRSQQVNITAFNYKDMGIQEVASNESPNLLKGVMKYDGILVAGTDTAGKAISILHGGSQFNLLIDLQDGGQTARNTIYGNNHSGVISVIGSDDGALYLYCNDSNLQITVKDVDDTNRSKVCIRVYGNNNTITINSRGSLRFDETASGNIVFGRVGQAVCATTASNNKLFAYCEAATNGFNVNQNTYECPLSYSETFDPDEIPADGLITKTVTMAGVTVGQPVYATFSIYNSNIELYASVSASNTVTVKFKNTSASAINLSSGTLAIKRV